MKHTSFLFITTIYLVFQVLRLLLLVVAPMHTPNKVMKVVLVEFLTVGFFHRLKCFANGCLRHKLTQLQVQTP